MHVTALRSVLILTFAASLANGDQWNKLTRLDIDETIQVPGATLPPGKYVVKLADSPSNRHIVRFFNEDQSKVLATILAVPNQRMRPSGKTQLSWYETPSGKPPALRAWFYPGDKFGQHFVYSKQQAMEIAGTSKRHVPTMDDEAASQLNSSAEANSDPPAWDTNTRVYSSAPDGQDRSLEEGFSSDEKLDSNPAYQNGQDRYSRYGRFGKTNGGGQAPANQSTPK